MNKYAILVLLTVLAVSMVEGRSKPPFMKGKVYYSLDKALKEPLKVNTLFIRDSKLTSLPAEIGGLKNLKVLYIKYPENLKTLPEEIGQCKSLTHIDIQLTGLETLPESFGKLTKLVELKLINNEIKSLPKSIGRLRSLWSLYLNGNNLSSLPEEICDLTRLEKLSLANNNIKRLPRNLNRMSKKTILSLDNNPVTDQEVARAKKHFNMVLARNTGKWYSPEEEEE